MIKVGDKVRVFPRPTTWEGQTRDKETDEIDRVIKLATGRTLQVKEIEEWPKDDGTTFFTYEFHVDHLLTGINCKAYLRSIFLDESEIKTKE